MSLTPGQKLMEKRFHDLVVKEALGTITKREHDRLERHQRLRRNYLGLHPDPVFEARREWEFRQQMKKLGAAVRQHTEKQRAFRQKLRELLLQQVNDEA